MYEEINPERREQLLKYLAKTGKRKLEAKERRQNAIIMATIYGAAFFSIIIWWVVR